MFTVKDVMSNHVVTVPADMVVGKAVGLMLDEQADCLFVLDAQGRLVGLLTESAVLAAAFDDRVRLDPISLYMTRKFVSIGLEDPIDTAVDLLVLHRIRRLPVVSGRTLVGVVTRRDVLQALHAHHRQDASTAPLF